MNRKYKQLKDIKLKPISKQVPVRNLSQKVKDRGLRFTENLSATLPREVSIKQNEPKIYLSKGKSAMEETESLLQYKQQRIDNYLTQEQ